MTPGRGRNGGCNLAPPVQVKRLRSVLQQVVLGDKHGHTSQLSQAQITDLVSFLESL